MTYTSCPIFTGQYPAYTRACMDSGACRLRVEGSGSIRVQPDTAVINLGVVTENAQLKTAQEENAAIMDKVIGALRGMGIPPQDMQTRSYTISPEYDYVDGKQVFRGYRVIHTLEITVREPGKAGEIIDTAVQNGVNQINSIRFTVSDPSAYYRQALKAAVDDAVSKAKALGDKLKVIVSPVPVRITETGQQPEPYAAPVMLQAAGTGTPVQTGQLDIVARLEAIFAYAP